VKRASNAVCLSVRLKRCQRAAFASFRLAPSFVTSLGMSVEAQRFSENDIEHSPPADLTAGSSLGYRLKIPRAITKLVDAYRPAAEPGSRWLSLRARSGAGARIVAELVLGGVAPHYKLAARHLTVHFGALEADAASACGAAP
jgi:hypothetical protein